MTKMKMHTPDLVHENLEWVAARFPGCITESRNDKGEVVRAVDFDLLRQELSTEIVEGPQERYHLNWPGKREALLAANAPIAKTLRPCRDESVDFDSTRNLFIEGDNLDALKLLQETYLNKVKMIYIDPPYNTGRDFVYCDNFSETVGDYRERSGEVSDDGDRLVANTEANGRFHSTWLTMMYPRIRHARQMLADAGVLCVSIDHGEHHALRVMCDEIFGAGNLLVDLVWANKEGGGGSDSRQFRIKHEHIVVYAKNRDEVSVHGMPVSNEARYTERDGHFQQRGPFYLQKLGMGSIQYSASLDYPITAPDGTVVRPSDNNGGKRACWRWSSKKLEWGIQHDFIVFRADSSGQMTVYTKQYLKCDNEGRPITRTQPPMGVIDEYSSTQATKTLASMKMSSCFSYSKPFQLIQYLIDRFAGPTDLVVDFFAGAGSTGHAVWEANKSDNGRRRFLLVQIAEPCEVTDDDGLSFPNVAAVSVERLRRVATQLVSSGVNTVDLGFRVLKVDSSNMKDVYYRPDEATPALLGGHVDNIKEDRADEDLLFQVLLDWGVDLSLPIAKDNVHGKPVYFVDTDALTACFASGIDEDFVKVLAARKPLRAVFRDAGYGSDDVKINVEQIFKQLSPGTEVKTL